MGSINNKFFFPAAKDFIPDFDFPEPLELAGAWEGDIVLESLSDIPQLSDTMVR